MARFLLVLQPRFKRPAAALIDGLQPLLEALQAEVEHRRPAHLSAVRRGGHEQLGCSCLLMCRPRPRGRCWSWR